MITQASHVVMLCEERYFHTSTVSNPAQSPDRHEEAILAIQLYQAQHGEKLRNHLTSKLEAQKYDPTPNLPGHFSHLKSQSLCNSSEIVPLAQLKFLI